MPWEESQDKDDRAAGQGFCHTGQGSLFSRLLSERQGSGTADQPSQARAQAWGPPSHSSPISAQWTEEI